MIKRLLCRIFGHKWHHGFIETACTRCRTVKQDRLWQLYGDKRCKDASQAIADALRSGVGVTAEEFKVFLQSTSRL